MIKGNPHTAIIGMLQKGEELSRTMTWLTGPGRVGMTPEQYTVAYRALHHEINLIATHTRATLSKEATNVDAPGS